MLAHWTWVVPSAALLRTPLVDDVSDAASAGASAAAVTMVAGSMPGSAADATTVSGDADLRGRRLGLPGDVVGDLLRR